MATVARIGAVFAALLACAAPAWGSATIGSSLASGGDGDHNCDPSGPNAGCTVVQIATPGQTLTAPFSGVIVRWRVRDYGSGTATLRVVRQVSPPGPPDTFSFLRSSGAEPTGGGGIQTFVVSPPLPISSGDGIGVSGSADNIIGHNIFPDGRDAVFGPPPQGAPFDGTTVNGGDGNAFDWLYNADIVAPPTSTAVAAACPGGSSATVTVTSDPDPATAPKAVHYKLDSGAEQVQLTSGSPGTATIVAPAGLHTIEYWGEDQLDQQEATHHTIAVGCAPVTAAIVSGASETHRTWRRGSHLASIAAKRPPVGTDFRFSLDKAAPVRFAFAQRVRGRKVNGKCVAQTKRNKRKPGCNRTVVRGSLQFTGHAGVNSVHFEGRVSKKRKLKPGKYTVLITATTIGAGSTSQRLTFRIVR